MIILLLYKVEYNIINIIYISYVHTYLSIIISDIVNIRTDNKLFKE